MNDQLDLEIEALKAENTRLREALQEYAYMHTDFCISWVHPGLHASRFCDCTLGSIARAALEGKE